MKRKKITEALNEISGKHIVEAAKQPRKVKRFWLGAIAAVLAIIIIMNGGGIPMVIQAKAVSKAAKPRISERGKYGTEQFRIWQAERTQREANSYEARLALKPFFADSSRVILTETGSENRIYSPINTYIGLAMAAELASGESRQQILDSFGVSDIETLRSHISSVWETCYTDDNDKCILANSLWLDNGLNYTQSVMDDIAHHYYASIYQADLGTASSNKAIQAWLNNNTGGLLKDAVNGVNLDPETVLALYSTIYFYSKWGDEFSASKNTQDTFHSPEGDITATFMNKKEYHMNYYWGESFGAVAMSLKNGSSMWFILPDEGKTVDDVLNEGQYMEMITAGHDLETYEELWTDYKYMKVNLSVPKFDVSSKVNLKEGLEKLGITDVFDYFKADFSDSILSHELDSEGHLHLTAVNQAARVKIDEQGVEAAVYLEIPGAGAAAPPEEVIDFVLDRPFIFVISKSNLPLFTGVVNNP